MYTKICTVSHNARVRVTSIYQSWIIYYCDVSGREETNIYTAPTVGQLQRLHSAYCGPAASKPGNDGHFQHFSDVPVAPSRTVVKLIFAAHGC